MDFPARITTTPMSLQKLSNRIRRSLEHSRSVEIAGLGVFTKDDSGEISFNDSFKHSRKARIFISYVHEDGAAAERLFNELSARGFAAWLDKHSLRPGDAWPYRIEDAIASSDFFIAFFSRQSVRKRGGFQTEIRHALNFARSIPLDEIFFIPVRLDDCTIPMRIQREIQYVDLFPDWVAGFESILRIIDSPKM